MTGVKLVPVDEEEFRRYMEFSVKNYAEEKVKSGNWQPEDAMEKSRRAFSELLPRGKDTPGHSLMIIVPENGERAGILWFEAENWELKGAYIWDIVVWPEHRGKGIGEGAMLALEEFLRARGIKSINLHVFGHNTVAISLYEKLGYRPTNMNMRKLL